MGKNTVDTESDHLRVQFDKLIVFFGKGKELGSTHGCEICRMRKENDPLTFEIRQAQRSVCCHCRKLWGKFV